MLRTIDGRVVGKVVHYNGTAVKNFFTMQFTGTVSPGQGKKFEMYYIIHYLITPLYKYIYIYIYIYIYMYMFCKRVHAKFRFQVGPCFKETINLIL